MLSASKEDRIIVNHFVNATAPGDVNHTVLISPAGYRYGVADHCLLSRGSI
jgi:hypothetical protein